MVTITTTGHCDSMAMAMAMVTSGDEKAKSTPGVEGDRQEKSSHGNGSNRSLKGIHIPAVSIKAMGSLWKRRCCLVSGVPALSRPIVEVER